VNSWKVILATMVIFGAGVVTGGLLVLHSGNMRTPRSARGFGMNRLGQPLTPGLVRFEFLRRAGRELDLTPEQQEKADKIIKESQERTRKVFAPYLREELQRTKAEFREMLTPEQRARFDQLLKLQQQRAREQHRPPPPAEQPAQATPGQPQQPAQTPPAESRK
jgi:Spy/CpxP family protein refolding chaperone